MFHLNHKCNKKLLGTERNHAKKDKVKAMEDRPIKSAERTLLLFELFASEQRPLTVKEVSEGMGMPQSSTSVLLKSLAMLGYLESSERTRTFYPTMRIMLLGAWMRHQHQRAAKLPQMLSELSALTGESVVLAMRNGIYSQYLYAHSGSQPDRVHVESGQLYPLACCSTGWCLLLSESKSAVGRIVRRTCVEAKNVHWRETAKLAVEHIEETRLKGYAFSAGETVPGLGAFAIRLPDLPGATGMSAAIGGPVVRIERKKDQILRALRGLAQSVRALEEPLDPLGTP